MLRLERCHWLDVRHHHNAADMVLLGIRRYSSKQLLSVVGSAAKLGFDDDMLMDTITSRLLKQVETLDAAQLVDLVSNKPCCFEHHCRQISTAGDAHL